MLYSCSNSSEPAPIVIKEKKSKTNPNSYFPISKLNRYTYFYYIVNQKDFYSFNDLIDDGLKDDSNMSWGVFDQNGKLTDSYLEQTFTIRNVQAYNYPIYVCNHLNKAKFSFYIYQGLVMEYDIESGKSIDSLKIYEYTFKDVKLISDTLYGQNRIQYRDYFFAKGIGLVRYLIKDIYYNPKTLKDEVISITASIHDYNIQ